MSSDALDLAAIPFLKGHGTGNDFVLIPDLDGQLDLSAEQVAAICDRRFGIGADGVLRVVRSAADPESAAFTEQAEFFMDYRNADGSKAEMCGNGSRLFVRYLVEQGLVGLSDIAIYTRGGVRTAQVETDGRISVDMGRPEGLKLRVATVVAVGDATWYATGIFMPNPHAVVFVDDVAEAGSLLESPSVEPAGAWPDGANVEFVVRKGPEHIAMRVFERGVGETQSCGTGACAAAVAAMMKDGRSPVESNYVAMTYRVDVPGGTLHVTWRADDHVVLNGPTAVVAHGLLDLSANGLGAAALRPTQGLV
jgi:diaminopimelate epimerase